MLTGRRLAPSAAAAAPEASLGQLAQAAMLQQNRPTEQVSQGQLYVLGVRHLNVHFSHPFACLIRRTVAIPGSHDRKGPVSVQSCLSFVPVPSLRAPVSRYPNNSLLPLVLLDTKPAHPVLRVPSSLRTLHSGLSSSTGHTLPNGKPDALTDVLTGQSYSTLPCVMT